MFSSTSLQDQHNEMKPYILLANVFSRCNQNRQQQITQRVPYRAKEQTTYEVDS